MGSGSSKKREAENMAKTKLAFGKLSGYGGTAIDVEGAIAILKERANDGDCEAQWMLGLCYEHGIGIEQDFNQAEILYMKSRDALNSIAYLLSRIRRFQRGTKMLKVKSGLWFFFFFFFFTFIVPWGTASYIPY